MEYVCSYFNATKTDVEGDSNFFSLTYENVTSQEELWNSEETVWLLGKKFDLPQQKNKFINFVKSRFWFTYRKDFSSIGDSGLTSDAGWGCMLRCGQMLLAQALSVITLNEESEWQAVNEEQSMTYKEILCKLSENPNSCYSIHQIAQAGITEGKAIGQWFGPNTISQVLRRRSKLDQENQFTIHVAMDNTVCIKEIENLCSSRSESAEDIDPTPFHSSGFDANLSREVKDFNDTSKDEKSEQFWKPLFLIIPLRLGLSEINPVYFDHLKEVLKWEESVGVIGGKPNHAYYFLGCSDDSLIFLDPHTTQPCVEFPDLESGETFDDETYHCESPSKMLFTQLDPSLALGFVCTTRTQFQKFCSKITLFNKTKTSLPLFEVLESFPQFHMKESKLLTIKSLSKQKRKDGNQVLDLLNSDACLTLDSDDDLESGDDEFEVLEFQ